MGCRHRRRQEALEELLAVGADQSLDEVLDVARLRQATLGQLVGQFGLGQSLVRLAGLLLGYWLATTWGLRARLPGPP